MNKFLIHDNNYDTFGRVTGITYPGRSTPVSYTYDALDRLRTIPEFVTSCSYDHDNKLTKMNLANGMKNSFIYDTNDRPLFISAKNEGNLIDQNNTYDRVGNIIQINQDHYSYDGLNRLVFSSRDSAQYSYDGVGNMIKKQVTKDGQVENTTMSYDLANRLWSAGSTTYNNSVSGERTAKTGAGTSWNYIYDGESRLVKAVKNGTTVAESSYDGAGMRCKSVNNGKTTYYIYSGSNPLVEYTPADGQYTYYIYAGKQAVAEERNGKKIFYHRDHLGSTRALTDQNRKLVGLCKYDAWGNVESTNEYDEGVINGDFEILSSPASLNPIMPVPPDYTPTPKPIYWCAESISGRDIECTFETKNGIDNSTHLSLNRNVGNTTAYWANETLFVSPDTDYVLSGYFLSADTNSTKAKAQLVYYDASGNVIATSDTGNLGYSGTTWKQFTLNSHAPANAAWMEIRLTADSIGGMKYSFDGIRLKVPGLQNQDKYDYTGKKEDEGTGLKYFGARFYDPEVGRFITQDPAKDGLNWFIYCEDNPINRIDSDGLYWGSVHGQMTRTAAATVGITNAKAIFQMVSANVQTDYQDKRNKDGYSWARHFDNPLTKGDERDEFAKEELQKAVEAWNNGDKEEAYHHLGVGLHSIQDKGSHKGIGGWNISHTIARDWFKFDVDDPKNDKEAADKAVKDSIDYLKDFLEAISVDNVTITDNSDSDSDFDI